MALQKCFNSVLLVVFFNMKGINGFKAGLWQNIPLKKKFLFFFFWNRKQTTRILSLFSGQSSFFSRTSLGSSSWFMANMRKHLVLFLVICAFLPWDFPTDFHFLYFCGIIKNELRFLCDLDELLISFMSNFGGLLLHIPYFLHFLFSLCFIGASKP